MQVLVFKDIKNKRWTMWSLDRKTHLGYSDDLILQNCSLFVDNEKREKILKTKKRFPHAWIIGTISNLKNKKLKLKQQISYNPFQNGSFMCGVRPCFSSKKIYLTGEGKVFKT